MDDDSLREDEITAIKSIYEEEEIFTYDDTTRSGSFFVKFESPTEFEINLISEKCKLNLKHLPPITLNFELPLDYPSKSEPIYTLQAYWLSSADLERLCTRLDELWEQSGNSSILFTWISFLADELFTYLNIDLKSPINIEEEQILEGGKNEQPPLDDTSKTAKTDKQRRGVKLSCSSSLLKRYNEDQEERKFFNAYHSCGVCFLEKPGSECFRFLKCEHIYCNDCMKAYFETQINDGNVKSLTCPYDKCETQAHPAQVLALVGLEKFNRYDSLLLKDSLNQMHDIVYCPRVQCQCAVIPTDDSLANCTACEYVFCALCRQGYHGIEPCKISNSQVKEICQAYESGDEQTRAKLIKQYGEKRIKRALEENASMDVITSTSKQCPSCKSWLQKLDGCNKMTCTKCHCYFCWLCLNKLSKVDPYSHFNLRSSECFERLFEGVVNENGEQQRELEVDLDADTTDDEDDDNEDGDDDEDDDLDEELALRMQLQELNA